MVGWFLWKFAGSKFSEGGLRSLSFIFGVTPVRTRRRLGAMLRFLHMFWTLNVAYAYLDDDIFVELADQGEISQRNSCSMEVVVCVAVE